MTHPAEDTANQTPQATSSSQNVYPPYRDPDFEMAVQTGINICILIYEILKQCPRSPPERLTGEAENLANFHPPTERLVGMVGYSGAGKSTTVNSLLDEPGLAKTEACGSAVTPFATEYRQRKDEHESPFTMECKLMDLDRLGKYLSSLLDDFRRIYLADTEEIEENRAKLEENSKAAKDIFEAAFGLMDNFDLSLLEHDGNEESQAIATNHLKECMAKLDFPDYQDDGKWTEKAADADECQDQQNVLLEHGLWPFVERLCIYANFGFLSEGGLTLVDLPGFNDTNLARIRAARKFRSKCDNLCIVVEIGRACDNPIVATTMRYLEEKMKAAKAPGFNVTIVCTKSADVTDRSIEKNVNPAELRQAKAELQRALKEDDKKRRKSAKRKLEALLINARNAKVAWDLKRKYESCVGNGQLKVFCVDNIRYFNRKAETDQELCGVPALRLHMADLSARSLFMDKNLFLLQRVPACLSSFSTFVDCSRVDHELEKRPRLPEADELRQSEENFHAWVEKVRGAYESCIATPLKDTAGSICSDCLVVAKHWESTWHWTIVSAWLRNEGRWKSETKGSVCWNSELLKCFNPVLLKGWRDFDIMVDSLLRDLHATVLGPFREYTSKCSKLCAPSDFKNSLSARQDVVKSALKEGEQTYFKETDQIKFDANAAHPESYIVDCMLDTYKEVAEIKGRGVVKARHRMLQGRVGSTDFVEDFLSHISEAFEETIDSVSIKIAEAIAEAIGAIEEDLGAIQPAKGKERLFKFDSAYGVKCEDVLAKAQRQLKEIEELARKARDDASRLYG